MDWIYISSLYFIQHQVTSIKNRFLSIKVHLMVTESLGEKKLH